MLALGLEGSANKLGAGIIQHLPSGEVNVLSNVRQTYITPPGEGFLPRDTAQHHRQWALQVIRDAIERAGIQMKDLDCICYTKGTLVLLSALLLSEYVHLGPGMGAPLQSVALVARTLSLLYKKPLVGVNDCVGRTQLLPTLLASLLISRA